MYQRCRLHGLHGNKWSVIGKELGVSGRAAQDKYRNLKQREHVGKIFLKSICVEFGPGGYVVSFLWLTSMPGTCTWKMLTFS